MNWAHREWLTRIYISVPVIQPHKSISCSWHLRCECDASLTVIYDPPVDMFGWHYCIVDGGRVKGLTRIHLICILRRENYPAIDVFIIEPRAKCTSVCMFTIVILHVWVFDTYSTTIQSSNGINLDYYYGCGYEQ